VYKAIFDFTMGDLPLEAEAQPGGLYPVVPLISNPDLCAEGVGSGRGVATGAVQKGLTTLRIVSRIAIGLRLLRVAFKAARIAQSILSRHKPVIFDGHEKGLHALALGSLRGETVMATACDDGYARLWDPTGLVRTLRPPTGGKSILQWCQHFLGLDV
jgi:hypothetical protein